MIVTIDPSVPAAAGLSGCGLTVAVFVPSTG